MILVVLLTRVVFLVLLLLEEAILLIKLWSCRLTLLLLLEIIVRDNVLVLHATLQVRCSRATLQEGFGSDRRLRWLLTSLRRL